MFLKPHGRYVTLRRYDLIASEVEEAEEETGFLDPNFSIGKTSNSQVGNDLYDVYKVTMVGPKTDFGYIAGDIVLVENNMVECVELGQEDVFFILENYIVGVIERNSR